MDLQLTDHPPPPIARVKLVGGIFFAALGILMTLDNLDLLVAYRFLHYWPVVLIAIGLLKLTERADRLMGVISLAAGALLLASNIHWIRFPISALWPLALIVAGAAIVIHALGWRPESEDAGISRPNLWAVLSTQKVTSDTGGYAGGRIVTFLGSCELDLTGATIENRPAVIEAFVMWGGIVIRVPTDWDVIGEVTSIMGGIDIKTSAARGGQQLIVRGLAFMGGMEIKSAPARTQ
jgi:predicted membrane protein